MTSLDQNPTDVIDMVDAEAGDALRCAACSHDLADHDAIEKRYCNATEAKVLTRNCICRST